MSKATSEIGRWTKHSGGISRFTPNNLAKPQRMKIVVWAEYTEATVTGTGSKLGDKLVRTFHGEDHELQAREWVENYAASVWGK